MKKINVKEIVEVKTEFKLNANVNTDKISAVIATKNGPALVRKAASKTVSAALVLVMAIFAAASCAGCMFCPPPAHAAKTRAGRVEAALPEIREAKTVEVCVLGLGAGTGSVGIGTADSPAFVSNGPSSFAVDKDENVYILDALNFRVLKMSKTGALTASFGYPRGETDNKRRWYYVSDIAISPKNGNIYLLNQTLKNIFILSPAGQMRAAIDVKKQCKRPHKIFVSNSGEIFVSDQGGGKVVVYDDAGAVTGWLSDHTASVYSDKKGFIFALGEFDKDGRDILLMDRSAKLQPKVFAKLIKSIKKTDPYDYHVLGLDANYNFYASIVEKIVEDVIQTLVYKFDRNGKTVERLKIMPFIHLGGSAPTRYFNVSPNGVLYGVTASKDYKKYIIVRIEGR